MLDGGVHRTTRLLYTTNNHMHRDDTCMMTEALADSRMGRMSGRPFPHWPKVEVGLGSTNLTFSPSFVGKWTKSFQIQGSFTSWPPLPLNPAGGSTPRPRYRLTLHARHGPSPEAHQTDVYTFDHTLCSSLLQCTKAIRKVTEATEHQITRRSQQPDNYGCTEFQFSKSSHSQIWSFIHSFSSL